MRLVTHDGIQWRVDELDATATPGSRGPRCLVFDADNVVRRVWAYPANWRELSDYALGRLVDDVRQPAAPPPAAAPRGAPASVTVATARDCADRTRALLAELAILRDAYRSLREDREMRLAECRRQRAAMRSAVETYALALRSCGIPPERAIVLLKSAMHQGIADLGEPDDQERDEVVRDGVAWAIEAYYAA